MSDLPLPAFTSVASAFWSPNYETQLVFFGSRADNTINLLSVPVTCERLQQGFDDGIGEGVQVEIGLFGPSAAGDFAVTDETLTSHASSGQAIVGDYFETEGTGAQSGEVTVRAAAVGENAVGTFFARFGTYDFLEGSFDAVYCPLDLDASVPLDGAGDAEHE